jgi:hypothetical protein
VAVKDRKKRVMLDLAKKVGEEVIEAINEDIEIQTGSGLRAPSDGKPKPPRKPPTPVSKSDAAALDGKVIGSLPNPYPFACPRIRLSRRLSPT